MREFFKKNWGWLFTIPFSGSHFPSGNADN